VIKMR